DEVRLTGTGRSKFLQAVEKFQRLARRELVRVDRLQGFAQEIGLRSFFVLRGICKKVMLPTPLEALLLEYLEDFPGLPDHWLGHPRERRHLQAVAAVGRDFLDRVQE